MARHHGGGITRVHHTIGYAFSGTHAKSTRRQPSGSDSPIITGLPFNSGNDAMISKPFARLRNWFRSHHTVSFTNFGLPLA